MPQPYSNVVVYKHTATDDLQFRTIGTDLWLSNANMEIVTKDCLYGKVNDQPMTGTATDVLVFDNFNLADVWFRNATAGQNTTINVTGITMSQRRMKELGLEV